MGGAVRRLRQRRADHHRRVHLLRSGQVDPEVRRGPAAAPRLRGAGAGSLVRPDRTLAAAGRRGRVHRGAAVDPGQPLPHAAPAGPGRDAPAVDRLHPEVDAAQQDGRVRSRRLHPRFAGRRCRPIPPSKTRVRSPPCCSVRARCAGIWSTGGRPPAWRARSRSWAWSGSTRCPASRSWTTSAGSSRSTRFAGCRTSRSTRARGRSWRSICRRCSRTAFPNRWTLTPITRPASSAPSVGSAKVHEAQQRALMDAAFG